MEENKGAAHQARNRAMFDAIARRYDLLNRLLSAGVDRYWRRRLLIAAGRSQAGPVLDLATGTADLAIGLCRFPEVKVVGVDAARAMLQRGRAKVQGRGLEDRIALLTADAEALPFADGAFGLVTAAFGVRNFADPGAALAEARRVLRPGGSLLVLEFSEPTAPLFRQVYRFYFSQVLPRLGRWISGHPDAYGYLPRSVATFPQGAAFLALLLKAGLVEATATRLTLGVCTLYEARRDGGADRID